MIRNKYKNSNIKTNLQLMEAFNETAMKFVPIYYNRVQKQEE